MLASQGGGVVIGYGTFRPDPDESAVITAERDQQNARPEVANGLRVAAEGTP